MGVRLDSLDRTTRDHMIAEIDRDIADGTIYVSNYLNPQGESQWTSLLREAAASGSDDTLAEAIGAHNLLRIKAERKTKNGTTMVSVPVTAATTLDEGEFGRYYARGLCLRAISEGIPRLEVYRGKAVSQPREGSEAKIGMLVDPALILNDLRLSNGLEPALGLPPGPNSGITLRIPSVK